VVVVRQVDYHRPTAVTLPTKSRFSFDVQGLNDLQFS
jgi:hypothetical protein